MGSNAEPTPKPWVQTPCIKSAPLSREAGCNIYMKLENLQPSGSFKSRGIGHLMSQAILSHGSNNPIRFYCSSGGNAGLACVTAAIALQRPATIVVPMSTSAFMVDKLRILGADVMQKGQHWSEADTYLREELLAKDEHGVYVPPFDHEDLWEGHGSLIDELEGQMASKGSYDALVCSVGGGGLFVGLMEGLERHGRLQGGQRKRVKVLAMETEGADSLAYSLKEKKLSRLPAITSIATSLGATQVAKRAFDWAQSPDVTSCVINDAEAGMGSVAFADDERILVEAACGVSVATAYNGTLRTLFPALSDAEFEKLNIVIVVCGGSNVTLQTLESYKQKYSTDEQVLKKFHARILGIESIKEAVNRVDKGTGEPFVMHDKQQHRTREDAIYDEKALRRPSLVLIDEKKAERQTYEHGKVLSV